MKFMPLMFAVIGFNFPGGLGLYWTVTNLFQIGQQSLLLRAGHIGPEALERRIAEQKEKLANAGDRPVKKGFLAKMMEQAEVQKQAREGTPPPRGRTRGGTGAKGTTGGTPKSGTGSTPPRPQGPRRKPNTGGNKKSGGGPKKRPGGGGGGASRG
jgi:YidC/Oxa1 family membrane protein insertase